jgi:hypothetical protein
VVTLTGVNIDADQLLLIVAPEVGRTMYNFASVTGTVSAGVNTRVTLNASTAGLTTTSPLVIFYDDQAGAQSVTGTVALDPASLIALENVTVTIGSAVTISGFSTSSLPPSTVTVGNTVTISGTVTANLASQAKGPIVEMDSAIPADPKYMAVVGGVYGADNEYRAIRLGSNGEIVVGSLPAISGTVTANVGGIASGVTVPVRLFAEQIGGPSSGQDTLVVCDSGGQLLVSAQAGGSSVLDYDGQAYVRVRTTNASSVTIGSLPAISGTVTVGAMPNGSLTTRFGTPTTANTAFATSAVTNTSRKYLLIQNVTTGSNAITVGIGFTPTTTQGIQLTAGAGITFESSYIPTGAVYILSSVTASSFTILEA